MEQRRRRERKREPTATTPTGTAVAAPERDVAGTGPADVDPQAAGDRDEIQRRAYERYQERGGIHGDDQADWFEAEREIRERAARR